MSIGKTIKTVKTLAASMIVLLFAGIIFMPVSFAYSGDQAEICAALSMETLSAEDLADQYEKEGYTVVEISTPADLVLYLWKIVNDPYMPVPDADKCAFILMNDINLSEIDLSEYINRSLGEEDQDLDPWLNVWLENFNEKGWNPIGTSFGSKAFQGIFDGAGHTINGLWIDRSNGFNVGLFGVNQGTIRNLNVISGDTKGGIKGKHTVGGIAALNFGIIENCTVSGSISGQGIVGGVSGDNQGKIVRCLNFADIRGNSTVGGIAGNNFGEITLCQNNGELTGFDLDYASNGVGGIIGLSEESSKILQCANYGAVSGTGNYNGGIAGSLSETGTIVSTLNLGQVAGASLTGGITGKSEGEISNSFYDKTSAGIAPDNEAGLTPNELITRNVLNKLNDGFEFWILREADGFHCYPQLGIFADLPPQKTSVYVYVGAPVLSKSILTEGQPLSTITFAAIADGVFVWAEPDFKPQPGEVTADVIFKPYGEIYGERLYKVNLTVKAKLDLAWLIVSASVVGGIVLAILIIFFTDKKIHYFARIKKMFSPKVIVREVVVEKPIEVIKYVEPEINTAALEDYMDKLTPRELEVAKKILEGKTRKEIAAELHITETTVKGHIANILSKTYCKNQRMFVLKFKK